MKAIKALLWSILPSLVAMSVAAGEFAFVTNQNSSDLSVLDLEARLETARIAVGGKPAGVVVHPQSGQFFTVSPDSKIVRKFEIASGQETSAISLDGGPIGIAIEPSGARIFVSDWYNSRIWVIATEDMRLLADLETGSAPAGLVVSHGILASADRDSNQVSIFDLESLELRHRLTVGERPFGISASPKGIIYAGNVGSNSVTAIDPVAGKVIGTIPVGDRPYGVAFANGHGFVTNQYADTVSIFDEDTLEVIKTLDVGEYPEGIDVTSDQTTIVVANWFSNTVSLIDTETLTVVDEIETGDGPRAFGRFLANIPGRKK